MRKYSCTLLMTWTWRSVLVCTAETARLFCRIAATSSSQRGFISEHSEERRLQLHLEDWQQVVQQVDVRETEQRAQCMNLCKQSAAQIKSSYTQVKKLRFDAWRDVAAFCVLLSNILNSFPLTLLLLLWAVLQCNFPKNTCQHPLKSAQRRMTPIN